MPSDVIPFGRLLNIPLSLFPVLFAFVVLAVSTAVHTVASAVVWSTMA